MSTPDLPPDPRTDPDWQIHTVAYQSRQLDAAWKERDEFYRWTLKLAARLRVSIADLAGEQKPPFDVAGSYAELRQRILDAVPERETVGTRRWVRIFGRWHLHFTKSEAADWITGLYDRNRNYAWLMVGPVVSHDGYMAFQVACWKWRLTVARVPK